MEVQSSIPIAKNDYDNFDIFFEDDDKEINSQKVNKVIETGNAKIKLKINKSTNNLKTDKSQEQKIKLKIKNSKISLKPAMIIDQEIKKDANHEESDNNFFEDNLDEFEDEYQSQIRVRNLRSNDKKDSSLQNETKNYTKPMKTIRIKFKEKSIQTIVDADIMKKARMSTIPLNVIKIKKEVEIKPQKQEREKEKPQIKQEPINQIQTQKETTKPAKKVIVRERTQQPTKKKILTVQTPEKKSQKPIQKQTVQHQIGKTDIKAGKLDGQMIAKKTSENLEPLTMKQIVELSKLSGELQTSQNIYGEAPIFGEQDSFQLNQNRNMQIMENNSVFTVIYDNDDSHNKDNNSHNGQMIRDDNIEELTDIHPINDQIENMDKDIDEQIENIIHGQIYDERDQIINTNEMQQDYEQHSSSQRSHQIASSILTEIQSFELQPQDPNNQFLTQIQSSYQSQLSSKTSNYNQPLIQHSTDSFNFPSFITSSNSLNQQPVLQSTLLHQNQIQEAMGSKDLFQYILSVKKSIKQQQEYQNTASIKKDKSIELNNIDTLSNQLQNFHQAPQLIRQSFANIISHADEELQQCSKRLKQLETIIKKNKSNAILAAANVKREEEQKIYEKDNETMKQDFRTKMKMLQFDMDNKSNSFSLKQSSSSSQNKDVQKPQNPNTQFPQSKISPTSQINAINIQDTNKQNSVYSVLYYDEVASFIEKQAQKNIITMDKQLSLQMDNNGKKQMEKEEDQEEGEMFEEEEDQLNGKLVRISGKQDSLMQKDGQYKLNIGKQMEQNNKIISQSSNKQSQQPFLFNLLGRDKCMNAFQMIKPEIEKFARNKLVEKEQIQSQESPQLDYYPSLLNFDQMPKESMNEFKNEKKDLQQTWKEIKEYLKHKKKDIIIQSSINEADNVQDYFHAVPGPPPIQAPIITHTGLLKTPKKHEHEQKHKSKKLKHHRHSSSSSSSNSDYSYSTSKSNSSSNSYNQSSSHYTPENYHRHRSRSHSYHRHSHHRHDHRKKDNYAGGHERK